MSAPIGNNYNKKWKTPEERKAACEAVCKHLASGLSKDCFVPADWQTVEAYIRDYPEDFDAEKITEAIRDGQVFWEGMGVQGATGKINGFNATTWIFNMKNRYGWRDRTETDNRHTGADGGPINHNHTVTFKRPDGA